MRNDRLRIKDLGISSYQLANRPGKESPGTQGFPLKYVLRTVHHPADC
jgi:hypothetical protein